MPHARKKAKVICHGPHALSRCKHIPVQWEDYYLKFKTRNGFDKYALTICSYDDLYNDLKAELDFLENRPYFNFSDIVNEEVKDLIKDVDNSDEIEYLKNVVNKLKSQNYVIDQDVPNSGLYTIYSARQSISKDHAEYLIKEFMKYIGYSKVSLNWKETDLMIIPT